MNTQKMKKIILPFAILIAFIVLAFLVVSNPPTTKRFKPSNASQLNVDAKTVQPENIALTIHSYGTVKPRTQSNLFPQVSGQITYISPNFREGGFFEKGEVLVEIDARDYQAEIDIAHSALFNAQQVLSEEQARVEQAKQDWQRLGNKTQAPDLVLRKPQLLAAQASVYSAQASLTKAELALERTKIIAPYQGRILTQEVDVGQVVSSGTRLAEIYAVDYVEVRLPIKNSDLAYIQLPERMRTGTNNDAKELPRVTIYSDLVDRQQWQGRIVRTEGAFDTNSQQLFVVAQIDDPYGQHNDQILPIKIGQYVTAEIQGKALNNALTVPNKTIYQGSYVYVVENNNLLRKNVSIAWQNSEVALIKSGLTVGDKLVLTPLGQITSGTPVSLASLDGVKAQARQKPPKNAKQQRKNKPQQNNGRGES